MKKLIIIATIFLGVQLISSCSAAQRIYVQVRPVAPVVARPLAPRPTYIWVEPEWVWRGSRYVYVNGYWAEPRVGYRYVPGYWHHGRRGDVWIRGNWRR